MGLDAQCCIFGELIVCVRTVQVPTGYKYGNVSWDVPCTVQPCVIRSHVWDCGEQTDTTYTYSGTGTLVPRGPYACTEQASVERARREVAIGNSRAVDSDVAVEEARRGSRIRLVLGGDLHRLAGSYGFAGAG